MKEQNLGTIPIPMRLNEEGVYVMDRRAYEKILSETPEVFNHPDGSATIRFFHTFNETLGKIKRDGAKRRYYTQ
jgi:hypothetical protein